MSVGHPREFYRPLGIELIFIAFWKPDRRVLPVTTTL